jgi:hypothetical protein
LESAEQIMLGDQMKSLMISDERESLDIKPLRIKDHHDIEPPPRATEEWIFMSR